MKKNPVFVYKILIMCVFAFGMVACKKDPFEGIVSHERAIIGFNLAKGQIGEAVIKRTLDSAKLIIYVAPGTDLTQVSPIIATSYKANIIPSSGEKINFKANNNRMVYKVTAESGEVREWTVEIQEFKSDLFGKWKVSNFTYFYSIAPTESWGWKGSRAITNVFPTASVELDNTLELSLEGVSSDGKLFGTYTYDGGADGKYADFNYRAKDYAYKFRKLIGPSGTWKQDVSTNTIVFNEGKTMQSQTLTLTISSDKKTLTMPLFIRKSSDASDPDWNDSKATELGYAENIIYTFQK